MNDWQRLHISSERVDNAALNRCYYVGPFEINAEYDDILDIVFEEYGDEILKMPTNNKYTILIENDGKLTEYNYSA